MSTIGRDLKAGDGKCWKHKGKFMGKLVKVQWEGRSGDQDPVYYFDNGVVHGNMSRNHDEKFTEVTCDGKAINKKNNTQKNKNNTPKVGDGKCWSIKGKYLGKFKEHKAAGRVYNQTLEYIFEHGTIDLDDYRYSGHKFKAVDCRVNKKANATRKNRK